MNKKRKGKTIEFKNLAFYDKKTAIFLLNNKGFSGFKTNSIFYHKSSKKHLNLVFFVGFPPIIRMFFPRFDLLKIAISYRKSLF